MKNTAIGRRLTPRTLLAVVAAITFMAFSSSAASDVQGKDLWKEFPDMPVGKWEAGTMVQRVDTR